MSIEVSEGMTRMGASGDICSNYPWSADSTVTFWYTNNNNKLQFGNMWGVESCDSTTEVYATKLGHHYD